MKGIYWFVLSISLTQIGCRPSLKKETQGVYLHYYTGNSSTVFGELHLLEDSLYTHDVFMFAQSGSYEVDDDSLYLILENLGQIAYKITKIDNEIWVLQNGPDSLIYHKVTFDYYRSLQLARIESYKLANIHTRIFLDTLDAGHSLIHFYRAGDSTKIRLNDATKDFEDIPVFLEPGHSRVRSPVYCMIGEGITVNDLYQLYHELARSNYNKTTLILAKSGKNRFEIFEDKFGLVSGSYWYSLNIDTAFYKNHPELLLHPSSLSDISDSTFQKLDDPYLIQIDQQVTLNVYIQIKEKVKKLAEQNGAKFQFIVPGID